MCLKVQHFVSKIDLIKKNVYYRLSFSRADVLFSASSVTVFWFWPVTHSKDTPFLSVCCLLQVWLRGDPWRELWVSWCAGEALQQHRPRTHHILGAVAPHKVCVRLRPPGGGLLTAIRNLQNRWAERSFIVKMEKAFPVWTFILKNETHVLPYFSASGNFSLLERQK